MPRTSVYDCVVWCEEYFDNLNRLGVTHECDRQTHRQTFSYSPGRTAKNLHNAYVYRQQ